MSSPHFDPVYSDTEFDYAYFGKRKRRIPQRPNQPRLWFMMFLSAVIAILITLGLFLFIESRLNSQEPTPPPDLLNTQVALALTQTAFAFTPTATFDFSSALATATNTATPTPVASITPSLTPSITMSPTLRVRVVATATFDPFILPTNPNQIFSLQWSPDGDWLAAGTSTGVLVFNARAIGLPPVVLEVEEAPVHSVAFSIDSQTIAATCGDGIVRLWTILSDNRINPVPELLDKGSFVPLWSIALSPYDGLIAVGEDDGTLRFWDLFTSSEVAVQKEHGARVTSIAFGPSLTGERYLASSDADGQVIVWRRTDQGIQVEQRFNHSSAVTSLAFNQQSLQLASADEQGTMKLWDVTANQPIVGELPRHASRINMVAFLPGKNILVSAGNDSRIVIWDLTLATQVTELRLDLPIISLAFTADGNTLAAGTLDGQIRRWNTNTWTEMSCVKC